MAEIRSWQYPGKAARDVEDILAFTHDQWGATKMLGYSRDLKAAILMLCEYPTAGHEYRGLKRNTRLWNVGSHIIIYRIKGASLVVVRILHQSMSLKKHL